MKSIQLSSKSSQRLYLAQSKNKRWKHNHYSIIIVCIPPKLNNNKTFWLFSSLQTSLLSNCSTPPALVKNPEQYQTTKLELMICHSHQLSNQANMEMVVPILLILLPPHYHLAFIVSMPIRSSKLLICVVLEIDDISDLLMWELSIWIFYVSRLPAIARHGGDRGGGEIQPFQLCNQPPSIDCYKFRLLR